LDTGVLWRWDGAAWQPTGAIVSGLYTDFATLDTPGEFDGEIRMALDTHFLYIWDGADWNLYGSTPIVDSTGTADPTVKIAYIEKLVADYTAGTGVIFDCSGLGFTTILGLECSVIYSNFDDIIGVNKIYKVVGTNVTVKIVLQYTDADEILLNELDPAAGTGAIELGTNITAINLKVLYN
jgi:hypothetical protein